jgi:hypothetical protein
MVKNSNETAEVAYNPAVKVGVYGRLEMILNIDISGYGFMLPIH